MVVLFDAHFDGTTPDRAHLHGRTQQRRKAELFAQLTVAAFSLRVHVIMRATPWFTGGVDVVLHSWSDHTSTRRATLLDALHLPAAQGHAPSPYRSLRSNCSRFYRHLSASQCAQTTSALLSMQHSLQLKRQRELSKGARFAAVFVSRLDVVFRTDVPIIDWVRSARERMATVPGPRRRVVVLPEHCEAHSPSVTNAKEEGQWKQAVCGGDALETMATPAAIGCHASSVPAIASNEPSFARRAPGASGGTCDRQSITEEGRVHYVLAWWLLATDSEHADEMADMASAAHLQATNSLIASRLSAHRPAPNPWVEPPQHTSAGFHWGVYLRHRAQGPTEIAWANLLPDVHFALASSAVERTLPSSSLNACEPPETALHARRVVDEKSSASLLDSLRDLGRGYPETRPRSSAQRSRRLAVHVQGHAAARDLRLRRKMPVAWVAPPARFDGLVAAPNRSAFIPQTAAGQHVQEALDWLLEDGKAHAGATRQYVHRTRDAVQPADLQAQSAERLPQHQHGRALTWPAIDDDERHAGPFTKSCATGAFRFLCGGTSDACIAKASVMPTRERSGFMSTFAEHAADRLQAELVADGTSDTGGEARRLLNRSASAIVVGQLARLWAQPCLVLRTSHCRRERDQKAKRRTRQAQGRPSRAKRELFEAV